jgi:hypothetical protein
MAAKKKLAKRATQANNRAAATATREPKKPKRVTALDAAARVLAEEDSPMSCGELIEVMAAKKYWSSPAGKTPASTLYAAILREVNTKGADARFKKVDRGKFARRGSA